MECIADTTDPATWGTFQEALASYGKGGWDSISFALGPGKGARDGADGGADLVAFDIDDCIDPCTGELQAWAAEVVEAQGTYPERSPSGRGARLIARGQKPGPSCRKGDFEM